MIFRLAAWDRRRGASRKAEDRRRRRPRLRPMLLVLEERKLLSTIVVNNPTDTAAAGQIDLRQAIATANVNGGSETITFDSTVFATARTIKLTNGPLELSDTTGTETITGPSSGLTISGGGLSGVFQVDKGVTASITGLAITGGLAVGNGGGVSNSGTLTLADCTVSGNTAGNGIGPADGGGIYNNGTLTLTDSTITANVAAGKYYSTHGGGLFNSGSLRATNCTVADNTVTDYMGGGGIQNSGGTATLINTIVADNTYRLPSLSGLTDIAGTVAGTFNLIGAGGSGGLVNGVGGNLVGVADPALGVLGDYGGSTETIPLLPGSPAIDAGTSAGAPAVDQRGESRVGAVDIGAFESQGFTLTPVAGSTPQTATIGVTFANPLAVAVTAKNPVEPVDGGIVNFAANPANDGATAILANSSAVVAGGQAGVTGGPNNMDGSYTVTASGPGLVPASLDLTNAGPTLTSLVVNTTSSSLFAGPGLLSLPLAVAFANTDTSGIASISFDPGVFGTSQTITLTGSQLELSNTSEAETITGPAAGVTISGARLSRVFQVDTGVTATITGLTITGGLTAGNGGGVGNSGTLTVTDCTVNGNTAGIGAGPADGGGIYNDGTLTVTDSTVTANFADGNYLASSGGGLFNSGTLNVTSSTITANFARYYGEGGGLQNSGGTATLTNTIVTDNKTYFGAGDIAGTVTGTYNLIGTGGSGGLANAVGGNLVGVAQPGLGVLGHYGGPTETIPLLPGSPAIDAGTSTGAPATDQRGEGRVGAVDIGAFESQGFTMTPVAGSTPQTATIGAAFSPLAVTVTANNPVEPVDGGIVDFAANPAANGASAILLASSDIIAGGQASVIGGPNNIVGSYTVTASGLGLAPASLDLTNAGPVFTSLVVNSTSGSLFAGAGLLSLPLAVNFANADTSGSAAISFDPGVFGTPQTITLTGSQLELSNTGEAETVTGPAAGVTISGGGLSRVFQVDKTVQATISGLTLIGGVATYGGAVNNLGTLTVSDCLFEHNTTKPAFVHFGGFSTVAEGAGGAIANGPGATLSLTDCTLTGNSTSHGGGSGGAISNVGTATLTDCSISGNISPTGGAIVNNGVLTLTGCQLEDNAAPPANFFYRGFGDSGPGTGGAIFNDNGSLSLVDCTLTGNSANDGGAIFNSEFGGVSDLSLTDCTISDNTAVVFHSFFGNAQPSGGAIYSSANYGQTTISLNGCTLTGNTAGTSGGFGGALASYSYEDQTNVSLKDCTLSGNATGGLGGAVNTNSGTLTMDDCVLTGNSAGKAGGGAGISGTDTLTNCTISGNTSGNGGGVDIYGTSQLSMSNCTVMGNTAAGEGGGLFVQGLLVIHSPFGTYTTGPASLTLNGVTISGNSATDGGGIYNAGTLTATDVNLVKNSATDGGGIDNTGTLTLSEVEIVNNAASHDGGGLLNHGTANLTNCNLAANSAGSEGGGVFNDGIAALTDCNVTGSSAVIGGGIYEAPDGKLKLVQTGVEGNRGGDTVDG